MKMLIALAFLFATQLASAQVPDISCFFMYSKVDDKGISKEFKNFPPEQIGPNKTIKTTHGFTLTMELQQIGPVYSLPLGSSSNNSSTPPEPIYALSVSVSNGESKSFAHLPVSDKERMSRLSTSLAIGKEEVFVNCDQDL